MKRREVIALLGGAAVAWPVAARARAGTVPLIGFLTANSADANPQFRAAVLQGMRDAGCIVGQNVAIDYRSAGGQPERLPELVAKLVARQPTVIYATGGSASPIAAKAATTTIPIVFVVGADPVKLGLVSNLARPDGNLTGMTRYSGALGAKKLELLRELMPEGRRIALLVHPSTGDSEQESESVLRAAQDMRQPVDLVLSTADPSELERVIANLKPGTGALLVAGDSYFSAQRALLATLAARASLPTLYDRPDFVRVGGLISYGARYLDVFYEAGTYLCRIVKGAKPVDLPVQQPSKFELVINLKTAKALGLTIPPTLLARADEVIE